MTVYHINPETKMPGICRPEATGICKFGSDQPHFDNAEEALAESDRLLSQEEELFPRQQKNSPEVESVLEKIREHSTITGATPSVTPMDQIDEDVYHPLAAVYHTGSDGKGYLAGARHLETAIELGAERYQAHQAIPFIKKDITAAMESGFLPKELTYTVVPTPHGVEVVVGGLQKDSETMRWEYNNETGNLRYAPKLPKVPSAIAARVTALVDAYNIEQRNHGKVTWKLFTTSVTAGDEEAFYSQSAERVKDEGRKAKGEHYRNGGDDSNVWQNENVAAKVEELDGINLNKAVAIHRKSNINQKLIQRLRTRRGVPAQKIEYLVPSADTFAEADRDARLLVAREIATPPNSTQ